MKKEAVIAIIFGVSLGAIFGFFLISKNKEIQINKNKVIAPTNSAVKNQKQNEVNFQALEVEEPNDAFITGKDTIQIKGKVTKGSLVVIQSPIKEVVFRNEQESFKSDFPLALGENSIKIVAYPNDKLMNIQEKELKIYYLQEDL
ncbi:hypothetical protein B6D29_04340 [Microgenomates bacterium UTCPR1]|nr:hypothetical protein [Patescibacteria group bacterium]OQY65182.1 MAG: hypothetical protein B6D29_04340 [Microgenomates bacterium UTCPR1]